MKKLLHFLLATLVLTACSKKQNGEKNQLLSIQSPPNKAFEQNWEATKNPATNEPEPEKLPTIIADINAYWQQQSLNKVPGSAGLPWQERGPNNIGGRTRAIMFDPNDPTHKKVWAGGVTGGLWYNNDITNPGSSWTNVDDFWDNIAISCIAADPNNSNIWYVGTGESWGQSFSGQRGAGIWKTTDGGSTWNQLSSTTGFYFVNDIVVRDESGTSVVYAGIRGFYYRGTWHGVSSTGLQRSGNGGSTWTQVLPSTGGSGVYAVADIEIGSDNTLWVGSMSNPYGNGGGVILKSTTGLSGSWTVSHTTTNGRRVELACAPSNSNYVYGIIEVSGVVGEMVRTANAGSTWTNINEPVDVDNGIPDTDFTRGQAWYDLIAAVDPTDENTVIVGGIDLFKTTDGGTNWSHISKWSNNANLNTLSVSLVHADQHQIVFFPNDPNKIVVGNDGGVFVCNDLANASTSSTFSSRNTNYNVTQFYAGALHPGIANNTYLAGAQDNGTLMMQGYGLVSGNQVYGGDGAFCFIDQNQPDTMIYSYVRNNYVVTFNGGSTISTLLKNIGGQFINSADYDNNQNILYAGYSTNQIIRTTVNRDSLLITLNQGADATAFKVSPYTTSSTTLFVGTGNGRLYKIQNANGSPSGSEITGPGFSSGTISSIALGSSENEIAVTFSNYGVTSIWYTQDGGSNWANKEGNLPDMPIRWFLFNPNVANEAIVATELGVWGTTNLNNASPTWTSSNEGLANVRVDMLEIRESDDQVLAVTHGRGIFTCDAFSEQIPLPEFTANAQQAAVNQPVIFTDLSGAVPTGWLWEFTPNTVNFVNSTNQNSQNPNVEFTATGTYEVKLTASNIHGSASITKTAYIQVYNSYGVPYTQNFDAFTPDNSGLSGCQTNLLTEDWINETTTDQSDWTPRSNPTSSTGTGPQNTTLPFGAGDHTSGTGVYLYTEASGCFYSDRILYSPFIDLSATTNNQLSFAYHMYSSLSSGDVGILNVYVESEGAKNLVFSLSGNQGIDWQTTTINLNDYDGKVVRFSFESNNYGSFQSDVCLDDVAVTGDVPSGDVKWDNDALTGNWSDAANWHPDGVPNTLDLIVLDNTYVSGSYTINVDAAQNIGNLSIEMGSNTVTLSGSELVQTTGVITPTSGTMAANGHLKLNATNETTYGQIAAGSGSITGDVINTFYYNGISGYRHIVSPVIADQTALQSAFTTLNYANNNTGSIWFWNENISEWIVPIGPSASFNTPIAVFMGNSYGTAFSPLPFSFDVAGTAFSGTWSKPLGYSVGADPSMFFNNESGWNFVPNPYPSALQWSKVTANPFNYPSELGTTYYTWEPALGAYSSYNSTTSTSVNGATDYIAKNKGFWIQASTMPVLPLFFEDDMRDVGNNPSLKTSDEKVEKKITLTANREIAKHSIFTAIYSGATRNYDNKFDHLYLGQSSDFDIYWTDGQNRMAFNVNNKLEYPMPFDVKCHSQGEIKLDISYADDFAGLKPKYIKNLETNELFEIVNEQFLFSGSEGQLFHFALLNSPTDTFESFDAFPPKIAVVGSNLRVTLPSADIFSEIQVRDLSGKLMAHHKLNAGATNYSFPLQRGASGVYIVMLTGKNESFNTKIYIP